MRTALTIWLVAEMYSIIGSHVSGVVKMGFVARRALIIFRGDRCLSDPLKILGLFQQSKKG